MKGELKMHRTKQRINYKRENNSKWLLQKLMRFSFLPANVDGFKSHVHDLLLVKMWHSVHRRFAQNICLWTARCCVNLYIYLSRVNNSGLAPPMVSFTHTGYHKPVVALSLFKFLPND